MEIHIKFSGQAMSVEVTVEVYEYLDRAKRKNENLAHEKRRHWDGREFDECIVAREGRCYCETPEQWLCHKETLQEIMAVLESCTGVQRQRFFLFALDGLSYSEIGKLCGCSKSAVQDSIEVVRKKCREFFESSPYEMGFSG
jgi:RNA polymerase sigma-70 factor (ECF subfamily)